MPWGSVKLIPGVDVEKTPTLNEAGYVSSRLLRFKDGLAQKMGGWVRYYANAVGGVPRGLHAWQDLNEVGHLAVGSTTTLGVVTDSQLTVITPQELTSNFSPKFSTTSGSEAVTVVDANIGTVTTFDAVEFRTPIAVGGLILSGVYPIDVVLGATSYRISASALATSTRATATITGATQANPCVVTANSHGFSNGDLIYISGVVGMTEINNRLFTAASVAANTFELTGVNSTAYTAYSSGGLASPSAVPFFTTTAGSPFVTVTIQDHGVSAGASVVLPISTTLCSSVVTMTIASPGVVTWFTGTHGMTGGESIVFTTTGALPTGVTAGATYYVLAAGITTTTFRFSSTPGGSAVNTSGVQSGIHTATVGSISISGTYTVNSVTDVDNFIVTISTTAGANSIVPMNGGDARLLYKIALGPAAAGSGYSIGTYSSGGYSTGSSSSAQEGTAITAVDWTLDNWGSTMLACPEGGGIYQWAPDGGFETAKLVSGAPPFNGGIFVAAPAQILIAWGSTEYHEIGADRDPLTYSWSDQLDFEFWEDGVINPATGNISQAGSSRIPTGSKIVAGMQAPQQALLWTDLDLWAINYIGAPDQGLTFGQNKIASSCGAIGSHAVGQLGNTVFWMGKANFFAFSGGGVTPLPCKVWDAVFQDLDVDNAWKVRACPITPFNEMMWEYPSLSGGSGQNDSYVKVNITDGSWDIGPINSMPRSAWIDQSVLGNPIGATPEGIIYQHEEGYDADGQPMEWEFTTGYWEIADGQDVPFVDMFVPDFKYGTYAGDQDAVIQITFYSTMYPGGTVTSDGPYTMTSSTEYITPRIRNRQMAFKASGSDLGSFARLGRCRFRFAPSGRF